MTKEFIDSIIDCFNENISFIEKSLSLLNEKELWQLPNTNSNSIGIICQHLSGNLTQYVISALGEKVDKRIRSREFVNEPQFDSSKNVFESLKETVIKVNDIVISISEKELVKQYHVQGVFMNGLEILQHVSQHFAYHTGQIVYLAKLLTDMQVNLYEGRDLDLSN